MNTINKERDDLETLLPWHAAGTLNRRDAERVEKALASDRELLRHFNLAREELNETIHLNETLGAPSARAMEKLFAAIEAEGAKTPARRQGKWHRAGEQEGMGPLLGNVPTSRQSGEVRVIVERVETTDRAFCAANGSPPRPRGHAVVDEWGVDGSN